MILYIFDEKCRNIANFYKYSEKYLQKWIFFSNFVSVKVCACQNGQLPTAQIGQQKGIKRTT